jgi:hypothetical protein
VADLNASGCAGVAFGAGFAVVLFGRNSVRTGMSVDAIGLNPISVLHAKL